MFYIKYFVLYFVTGSNLLVKNLIQCYQHEISFNNDILDCKCSWDYIHVLFCDDSMVRFPWQRNLQQDSFKWINYPNSLKWSEDFLVKSVSISTVVIKESEMFSHYGLLKMKLDSLIKYPADTSLLISCSDSSLFLVDNSGPITKLCFFGGQNFTESYFIPLTLPADVKIVQISCGKAHTILLSSAGCVYTFGVGTKGELGHGNTDCLKEPKLVEALLGLKIKKICAGGWHSACLTGIWLKWHNFQIFSNFCHAFQNLAMFICGGGTLTVNLVLIRHK